MSLLSLSLGLARGGRKLCITGTITRVSQAGVSGKALKEHKSKPAPYPYKEKNYNLFTSLFDKTTSRMDENSKIIVVEGPPASGKTEFAKALAQDLDMYHIPEATMDLRYINPYGYDMRQLDPQLPESLKSFDEKNFCQNPKHFNVAAFQVWKYMLRYSIYIDALAHLLSTGQGVVMERSPWGDSVFVEAMKSEGFMSPEAVKAYYEIRSNTIHQLIRPHLFIYLDLPVEKVVENIKKRGNSWETNSPALTPRYLQKLEDVYKTQYLREMSDHAELLMYNWSEKGDIEVVVEDIERINFDKYTKYDRKLKDWCLFKESDWAEIRMKYADDKEAIMGLFNIPILYAPELGVGGEDLEIFERVWYSAPGMEYEVGYDKSQGDSGLLFKTKNHKYVPY